VNSELLRIVDRRLDETAALVHPWSLLVLAACEGPETLNAVLAGSKPASQKARRDAAKAAADESQRPGAYLGSITVEGFRGVGPKKTLELQPGPGLTLVVGRNGSGKSSFAEAVEILLTGTNSRWARRSKIWQEGWRNLHHPERTEVAATFAIDGQKGEAQVARRWAKDAPLNVSTAQVRRADDGAAAAAARPLTDLGWESAIETFRPFLSYNELGQTFDEGPTEFHDRLSRILGLGDLEDAQQLLKTARLARQKIADEPKQRLTPLLAQLDALDDPRARAAAWALRKKTPDLDAAERVVAVETADPTNQDELNVLRYLANVPTPDPTAIRLLAEDLEAIAEREAKVAKTPAGEARDTVELLTIAVRHFDTHGEGDCPVCGKRLALLPSWRERTQAKIRTLTENAREADAVAREARALQAQARSAVTSPPDRLELAAENAGLDAGPLIDAWRAFAKAPEDAAKLPDHLRQTVDAVAAAAAAFKAQAREAFERRQELWAPLAKALTLWLPQAREATKAADQIKDLKTAEAWLKDTSGEIRAERFAPIATEAIELWKLLRQQSSVELERVMLAGQGSSRHVELDVRIDGVESAALGVMSQGELHAMALSLFLPRATLPESPFRFVVIDDPVQSMDPSRVDGLARVLEEVAKERQVVVFTHDDRLPESTRRLGIDARVIEVSRRENSEVDLISGSDPAERNLDDAEAIASDKGVPDELARQVVPGYCRAAIEATCIEIVRRRRIRRGESHAQVERVLESNGQLKPLLSLVLFDTPQKGGEVTGQVNGWGYWASEVLDSANHGAHKGAGLMPLDELVMNTRKFCTRLHELNRAA
jgi:DNA repair exonuclease SbcCD ATPase subunit